MSDVAMECHICHRPLTEDGEFWCSAAHNLVPVEPSAASGFDREAMIAAVRERGTPTSVHDLFECIGKAGREVARAIREDDGDLGVGACSAFLNAIEMMPASLREDIATAATERPGLAEWPDLREFAHGD